MPTHPRASMESDQEASPDTTGDKPSDASEVASVVLSFSKAPSKIGRIKRKGGSSCHQCKNVKLPGELTLCAKKFEPNNPRPTGHRGRKCRKKYCSSCMNKYYSDKVQLIVAQTGACVSCLGVCACASCSRNRLAGRQSAEAAAFMHSFAQPGMLGRPYTSHVQGGMGMGMAMGMGMLPMHMMGMMSMPGMAPQQLNYQPMLQMQQQNPALHNMPFALQELRAPPAPTSSVTSDNGSSPTSSVSIPNQDLEESPEPQQLQQQEQQQQQHRLPQPNMQRMPVQMQQNFQQGMQHQQMQYQHMTQGMMGQYMPMASPIMMIPVQQQFAHAYNNVGVASTSAFAHTTPPSSSLKRKQPDELQTPAMGEQTDPKRAKTQDASIAPHMHPHATSHAE